MGFFDPEEFKNTQSRIGTYPHTCGWIGSRLCWVKKRTIQLIQCVIGGLLLGGADTQIEYITRCRHFESGILYMPRAIAAKYILDSLVWLLSFQCTVEVDISQPWAVTDFGTSELNLISPAKVHVLRSFHGSGSGPLLLLNYSNPISILAWKPPGWLICLLVSHSHRYVLLYEEVVSE